MDRGRVRGTHSTSGTERRAHSGGTDSKQEADVTVKEEVQHSPESTQQLEPEYLNCAADVSHYRQDSATISSSSHGSDIENGEQFDDLHPGEIGAPQIPQIMGSEPPSIDSVTSSVKRLTREESPNPDGDSEMKALCDCCKRSRLLPEPQPLLIDGNQPLKSQDLECEHQPLTAAPSNDERSEPVFEEESNGTNNSTASMPEKSEMDGKPSTENDSDDITYYQTERTSESKEVPGQPRTLEQQTGVSVEDEDLYRDEEEIKKEKTQKVASINDKGSKDLKLGVGPEMDVLEYCRREWRSQTTVAKKMKEGYEEVSHLFGSIRQIRGDNYCALRATLFQCLSQSTELPVWLDDKGLFQSPEELSKTYKWIKSWRFWSSSENKRSWLRLKECLELLKKKWTEMSKMEISDKKQEACDEIFQSEEEYCLYEAVKFLMLRTAINLYNANEAGREVPVFSWLLFARNTSNNPCEFMKNHLNQVGHSGGLEQVEMFLLGYALQHKIKVYRLYKYGTDEFVTYYPDDQTDWPVVHLITEDDRHYNVPVRMCEETSF